MTSTVLLPDMLATRDNCEAIIKQLPKSLRKIVHFSLLNTWWVDGRWIPDELLSVPLQIAQRPVIVRGWLAPINFNLWSDPLPGCTIDELLEGDRVDKILSTYGAKALLFLVNGTVLMMYDSYTQIGWKMSEIPTRIAGYITVPVTGNIVSTSGGCRVGQSVHLASRRTPSSRAGVTVRRKSDGRLFDTIPSHLPHIGYLDQRWVTSKLLDYLLTRTVPLESFDKISYGPRGELGTTRNVSMTFDPDLTTQRFPASYAHDLSLVATETALDSPSANLQWSSLESPPFGKLVRLLNPDYPSTLKHWSISVGLALCRNYRESPKFSRSWLWRAGVEGESDCSFTTLAGLSGSALAIPEQHNTWGVIGFQNFEVTGLEEQADCAIASMNKAGRKMKQGFIGFHGSFILPKGLMADYEIVTSKNFDD
ncbi:hypothetical protein TWF281_002035 [Arthrobotrys megalospora]